MVAAGGHMAHMGFGFGVLNFFGTILFFVFAIMAIKLIFRGMRYSGFSPEGSPDWRQKAKERYRSWAQEDKPQATRSQDEAMQVARDRLANSELSPEEFEDVKDALKATQSNGYQKHDDALHTVRMRFAKGELSKEEFDAVIKALS